MNACIVLRMAVLAAASAAYSCGGSSPTSPTGPPVQAPAPAPAAGLVFDVEMGVLEADQTTIRDSIELARDYLAHTFQWEIPTSYTVSIRVSSSGTTTATAGSTGMTVYAGSPGWVDSSKRPSYQRKIIAHELFHTLQATSWQLSPRYTWLIEGSAEYVGFQAALVEPGNLSTDRVRGCAIYDILFNAVPPLAPLASYENTTGPSGQSYNLFYLAVELLTDRSGLSSLRRVTSFDSTFGRSASAFYAEFEEYRAGLRPPSRFDCYA